MPVADALAVIIAGVEPLPEEQVTLEDAFHRTLARDVASLRTQPPAAMSSMDGYAVRAADATLHARLNVVGEIAAGRPLNKPLGPGQAARIFTGGIVPEGSDTIVIQENTARDGDVVIINKVTIAGKNIRQAGIDFREGDILLQRGARLTDRDLALAASMNHPRLTVYRRPKVAILATGDELVMPGETPGPGQIVYSNGYALRALARSEGADVMDLGIVNDTIETTSVAVRRARELGADILITSGGVSVGDHDVVKHTLESEGIDMAFWRIALRPGKPMMHGRLGSMRVLGLPGNPVSSYVCAFLFMVPLIRALSGRAEIHHMLEHGVLGKDLPANDDRQDYLRAHLTTHNDGLPIATAATQQDSSLLRNLTHAQALIIRPPHAPAATTGAACSILRLPV